ncbi:M56 family metallopeptidase [Chryseobacterium indologenes]|uniref:Antirepressor n=1 Tax=Chryseobacterium indologenes TaxID=253 RepID=A0A0N1KRR1_CHRID|nr:M56 family metallopeptidase [Chryseobacterium indologenes]KPE50815.1 antirepressor [Chryseobacterium indologenes]
METLLLYFGKVILCSGVTFLYYQLSLKDKTFHHYNRFYLLAAMVVSLLLPLIKIEDFTIEVNNDVYMLLDKLQNFNTEKNINNDHTYFRIIFSALGLVTFYFLGKLIYGVIRIQQLKSQFQKENIEGINFYHTDLTEAPFSYFKNLFWKNTITLNSDIGKQILKHEMVHIEQKHSFDKIFIEIITSLFWFNPFFHIIKKEISLIHEYLADKKAVKQSDTKAFAQMLLASHFSGTQLPATSPFLSSNLKKRLKMLQKPKTKFGYARRIFALPVLFSVAFAYLVNAKNKEIKETNIVIEKAVSQIKKDTVTPQKAEKAVKSQFFKEPESQKEIKALGQKIQEKSKALKGMKPDSKEFEKSLEEIGELSGEIGRITNSDNFKIAYTFDTSELKKVNEYFKSIEWKNKMKAMEDMGVEIPDLSNLNIDFPDAPPAPPRGPGAPSTPPSPPGAPKMRLFKSNDYVYENWSPKAEAAPVDAKKAAKVAKVRAEIARKKAKLDIESAKLEGEKAKLEAQRRALDAGERNVYVYRSFNFDRMADMPKVEMEADFIRKDPKGEITMNGVKRFKLNEWNNTRIFIDGKEVSREEMEALKPDKIASITINKNGSASIRRGEIRIQTKK